MSALAFLALAGIICAIGFTILYLRSRQPSSLESGIDDFKREMHALSPEEVQHGRHRRQPDRGNRGSAPPSQGA